MINYIDDLPLPNHLIPSKLKELLSPIDDSPLKEVEQRIESLIHHTGPDGIEAPQWY